MRGGTYLVVLACVAVLAGGCGTESAQAGGVAAAAANTAGQSARLAETTTMQMRGMSVSFTETGVFDFAHSRGMLRMQGPAGMATEAVFVPPTTYLKLPGGALGAALRGKSWIAITVPGTGGLGASLLGPFGGTDPGDLLSALTAVSASVTKLGNSTIRGVEVTGYRVSVDPAKAASLVPHWQRAGLRAFARALGAATIPVEVWVDQGNLVRRVRLSLRPPSGLGAPAGSRITQTLDFSDFGVPVRVSAPPAAEVASMSQLARGGAGSIHIGGAGSPRPPRVSGTLSPAQAAAAEQAVRAFWSALGGNNVKAAARTVLPSQRACFRSVMGGPRLTVAKLRVVSARPAGTAKATVRFTVKARARLGGHSIPVFPQGPGHVQWLVTAQTGGHWYVDLARSTALMFGPAC